ncbi:MAG: ATP synthase A1 subunit C [Actinobacteria bacterium]|nr:ATP synthase A1 subunit C [Actinomycetota bacterium]
MARLEYENARLRSLKRDLLSKEYYDRLLESDTPEEMVNIFSETVYGSDISAAVINDPGYRGIENGLKENLARSFSKIVSFFSSENKYLAETMLGRYDIWNIKAIIRGKHIGASYEEIIEAVMPAGELTEPLLRALVEALDIKNVIDLLTIWGFAYSRPLRDAYPEYHSSGKLLPLELSLDFAFYERSLKLLDEHKNDFDAMLLSEFIRQEIDFVNIMTAIRLSSEKTSPEDGEKFFVPGGRKFPLKKFKDAVRLSDPEMIISVLSDTPYSKAAQEGLKRYLQTGYVSAFQRALEEFIVRQATKLFLADPLSSAMLIAYFYAKHNEVTNLRIIVRGKSVGMNEEEIREAMIIV